MGQTTEDNIVVSLEGISKSFRRYNRPVDRLKEILLPGKSYAGDFWAVRDIHLQVHQGETLGIIGQNGSGKSTLLQIIAGTLQPSAGKISVRGRVSALLELGSGFNPEFTGRQNVFFNGQILGLTQREIAAKFDDIAAFADIGDFIDQPVKTYSSGMFVRLAFAVAVNVKPEILIVDEALSVGDGVFVHRCMAKIQEFQDQGGTILFVSHDVEAVARLCSRMVWLRQGALVAQGEPTEIARQYQAWVYDQINAYQKSKQEESESAKLIAAVSEKAALLSGHNPFTRKPYQAFADIQRFGSGRAEIVGFEALDEQGKPLSFVYPGDVVHLFIQVRTFHAVENPIVGVSVYDRLRTQITGFNTHLLDHHLPSLHLEAILEVKFHFCWPEIQAGNYILEVAIADGTQQSHEMLDWLQCPLNLVSGVIHTTFGLVRVPEVQVSYEIHPETSLID